MAFLLVTSGDNQPELSSCCMQVTNGKASNPDEYASNPVFPFNWLFFYAVLISPIQRCHACEIFKLPFQVAGILSVCLIRPSANFSSGRRNMMGFEGCRKLWNPILPILRFEMYWGSWRSAGVLKWEGLSSMCRLIHLIVVSTNQE
jgi:hypothetical protein